MSAEAAVAAPTPAEELKTVETPAAEPAPEVPAVEEAAVTVIVALC